MAQATISTVEAHSLGSVIELASNPPADPNTRVQSTAEPLVLYIARVPGSRDVFLTPMKPREKIVTAEDVQSSLYYVHVSCDEDYEPPPPSQQTGLEAFAGQAPSLLQPKGRPPPLPRRPVSRAPYAFQTPPYPIEDPIPSISEEPPSPRMAPQHISRKPVLSDITNTSPARQQPAVDLPTLPARPLPPVPGASTNSTSRHAENLRLLRMSSHLDEHENPYYRDFSSHPETVKQREAEHAEALRKLELEARPETGSLTLIRRDPASAKQWNVASVYDPPVHEVSSSTLLVPTAKRRTKKAGAPVYLDITNPGYATFCPRPSTADASESRPSLSSTSSDSSDLAPDGTFRRRLYMPGSRYAEHTYHRKSSSVSAASGSPSLPPTLRDGRHSVDMGTVADHRSKGYTFVSPWDGTCEFTTGATGRSLKCRHRLGNAIEEVSELRFNLPTNSKSPAGLKEKRSSYFHRHRKSSTPGLDEDDEFDGASPGFVIGEDGRLDLSLGQERAGGGFGGSKAKLGKLIVMPAGVKMLDLLVAANIGLWWRAWERG